MTRATDDTQPIAAASGSPSGGGQWADDTQTLDAPADPSAAATLETTASATTPQHLLPGAELDTTPMRFAPWATSGGGHRTNDTQGPDAPVNPYDALRVYAETFNDVQEFRKAINNKLGSETVEPLFTEVLLGHLGEMEKMASKVMKKRMRKVANPGILAWQKEQGGIGEHLLARLLGAIGTPRVAIPRHWEGRGKDSRILVATEPRPRSVSQLWSYCGHGDPDRKLHKGMSAEEVLAVGNKKIKAIVWNIACACVKAGVRNVDNGDKVAIAHYGEVYLGRRTMTADREHATECVRCGPSGKPAQPGSLWSKAHQHADALRIVGKEVLRDLWIAAGDHAFHDAQTACVPGHELEES